MIDWVSNLSVGFEMTHFLLISILFSLPCLM
jgi:hypothetical protein